MPYMQISERLLILRLGLVCNSSYVSAFSTYLKLFWYISQLGIIWSGQLTMISQLYLLNCLPFKILGISKEHIRYYLTL